MAKRTRVERWAEDSGNAGLAGRELPPAEVLAADQRVTAWAKELRKAGLDGTMDQLRARAFMDLLLGTDSRPPGHGPGSVPGQRGESADSASGVGGDGSSGHPQRPGEGGSDRPESRIPTPGGPLSSMIPPAFAGRLNLTIRPPPCSI